MVFVWCLGFLGYKFGSLVNKRNGEFNNTAAGKGILQCISKAPFLAKEKEPRAVNGSF